MKNVTSILILLAAITAPVFASVNFTVRTNRATVAPGETAIVEATLVSSKAVSGGAPTPQPSDAFDVLSVNTGRSEAFSMQMGFGSGGMSGQRTYTYRYTYTITPRAAGAFTFPPLTVNIDGVDYSTRPLYFNADGNAGAGTAATAEPQRSPDVTASLTMSKRTLYQGEQAVLTFKIAQKANSPTNTQQGFTNAHEQIERAFGSGKFSLNRLFTTVEHNQEHIDGELHHTFILRYAVFGLTSGEHTIPGITFEYDEILRLPNQRRTHSFFSDPFGTGFFGGGTQAVRRVARTAPFTVTVKPMPPGMPTGFSGSVGRFTIAAIAEPATVPAGEAITLRITLQGNTRASNVGDPILPEIRGVDLFPPEQQIAVDTGAGGLSTKKTYRYLMIPRDEGELAIGPIIYHFLDSATGTYKTVQTDPIIINVTPGRDGSREQTRRLTQEEILQVGHDIRYIKMPQRIRHQDSHPYRAPHWYLFFPMPFMIFLFALIYKSHSRRSDENIFKSIRQKALANAVRELNKASKSCSSDNVFLGKASIVIEKYISNKLAFPATGRTLEELKDELLSRKIDEHTVTGLTVLIEGINEYRFGGKAFDTQSRSDVINQTIIFLSTMERTVKKEKTSAPSSPVSALIVLSLITAAAIFPVAASTENSDYENAPELSTEISYPENEKTQTLPIAPITQTFTSTNEKNDTWFRIGNEFYAAGLYDSALTYYARIVDAGIKNSSVYFNMGNCYHRLRNQGMARLYYERAAVLSPNDADIQANINFIKSIIVDRVTEDQSGYDFLSTVMYNIHTLLSLKNQLILLCVLLFILSLLCSAILLKKGLARLWFAYGAVLCALLITIVGASAGYKIYAIETRQYAIVMTHSVDAQNQPAGGQTLFIVHEGTKLRINETVGEWSLVSLPNGSSGWVTTSSLGKI
ncbi:MAG: BatD family protein [Chitinispirillales bacterium]|nr:BatD family protein [Chitinispirillales bacterium]